MTDEPTIKVTATREAHPLVIPSAISDVFGPLGKTLQGEPVRIHVAVDTLDERLTVYYDVYEGAEVYAGISPRFEPAQLIKYVGTIADGRFVAAPRADA